MSSILPNRRYGALHRFCNTEIRCCCKEESKSGNEEISPTMTDTARKEICFLFVWIGGITYSHFFRGSKSILRRSTPMCNKNKITARKEETHAEVTDSQRRNAPL